MIDRSAQLSPHFTLGELVPAHAEAVPADVRENLASLCLVLEAVRWHFGLPVIVHDGWRPAGHNVAAGGVPTSDHLSGRAADFHVAAGGDSTWEQNTIAAFAFLRDELRGRFGQIILEDHREHYQSPGKLWVHVAIPSPKHSGADDTAAVLISTAPGQYASAA